MYRYVREEEEEERGMTRKFIFFYFEFAKRRKKVSRKKKLESKGLKYKRTWNINRGKKFTLMDLYRIYKVLACPRTLDMCVRIIQTLKVNQK